jgi:transcriptional regulator GlxA family with amidase domain
MSPDYVIAIPIYQGVDLMDVAAPYEIFKWMANLWKRKNVQVYVVAETQSSLKTRDDLQLTPHLTFDEVKTVDLLWIPGGDPDALVAQMGNINYVGFIQSRSLGAQYVTSVCEGALIAANAGLLNGYEVTTHWAFTECLRRYYPNVKLCEGYPRYVQDRNRVTGGGISSGLDEALYLVKLIAGEAIAEEVQVTIQYFPRPPVDGKIPSSSTCVLGGRIPVTIRGK